MIWNYHDEDVAANTSPVELNIKGLEKNKVLVHHYRVDKQFSNSFEKWKAIGKPQQVTEEQYKELEKAGQLQLYTSPEWKETKNGTATLKFDLALQAVSFIQLTW